MTSNQTFVIVGASLAGAKAAETLRAEGFDVRLVLIGAEHERPYERPPLSKDYLRGEVGREKIYVHDAGFYAGHDIELRLGRSATSLNTPTNELALDDGERLRYDRLLAPDGSVPRSPPRRSRAASRSPCSNRWASRSSVCSAPRSARSTATSTQTTACRCCSARPSRRSKERLSCSGSAQATVASWNAISLSLASVCSHAPRSPRRPGSRSITGSSSTSTCRPVSRGCSRPATSPTRSTRYGERVRVEHWANALHQGPVAARAMLAHSDVYDRLPYFFSDQYEVGMEYSGFARSWDRVVFRGDPHSREFIAFWMTEDRVLAGMNVNVWDVTDPIQRLIRDRVAVDDRQLADPDIPLEDLASTKEGSTS